MTERTYRIREFANLAGVTVRALHHYDRLGLLRPRRTQTGYRVYSARDLELLEQIVALKFIGLPLNKIKHLLRRNIADLSMALRAQRTLLEEKKSLLERAISAVGEAERALLAGQDIDGRVFRHIIEVMEMQNNNEEWNQKYEALVQGKMERLKAMSPEEKVRIREQWTALFRDIEKVLNEDPASARVQQLTDRWMKLLGAFAPQGSTIDPQLVRSFGAAYPPAGAWPAGVRKPEGQLGDQRIWDFMAKALSVRA
jgi:MerR family transcriptional regulator, thiopeptide resistance regulator